MFQIFVHFGNKLCYSVQDGKMERLREEEEEVGRTFIISKLFSFFFFFIIGLMHFLILLLLLPWILFLIFIFIVFLGREGVSTLSCGVIFSLILMREG